VSGLSPPYFHSYTDDAPVVSSFTDFVDTFNFPSSSITPIYIFPAGQMLWTGYKYSHLTL